MNKIIFKSTGIITFKIRQNQRNFPSTCKKKKNTEPFVAQFDSTCSTCTYILVCIAYDKFYFYLHRIHRIHYAMFQDTSDRSGAHICGHFRRRQSFVIVEIHFCRTGFFRSCCTATLRPRVSTAPVVSCSNYHTDVCVCVLQCADRRPASTARDFDLGLFRPVVTFGVVVG